MDKLQWGSRKRLRCVKVKSTVKSDEGFAVDKKITSRIDTRVVTDEQPNHFPVPPPRPINRIISRDMGIKNNERSGKMLLSSSSFSAEKEEDYKYYTTRGSVGLDHESSKSKILLEASHHPLQEDNNNRFYNSNLINSSSSNKGVWPRLFISLSSKEKEEDFMAMKGCKPPQRPKKRAKLIQKTILFVSPGAWLSDLCQERYEVREKKTSKKRPRGLKAMGSIESDSE